MDSFINSTMKTAPADPLVQLLEQNEGLNVQLGLSADTLAAVAVDIEHALACHDPRPGCATALAGSRAAAASLRDLSRALSVTNQALAVQVRENIIAGHLFAATVEQEQAARIAALHDRLTGLPNRTLFRDRLEHGIARAVRHDEMLSVMFVDLNKFKSINDTHGHSVGDAVLKVAAQRLTERTRAEDTVSRHGGDEFLYLFTDVRDSDDCAKIAGKILQAIQAPCTVYVGGRPLALALDASIGIAVFPRDGLTADALINSADGAMYRAKQSQVGYAFAR